MTLIPLGLVLFQHRNIGALAVLHASVCLGMDFEQKQKFAEPQVVHSQLKCSSCNARGANEDKVLTVGSPQFLFGKRV